MSRIIVYLAAITWAIYCYSNAFFFLPIYLGEYNFSKEHIGILAGAFYAATTLIRPVGGWIVERVGMRRALVFSGVLCLVAASLKFFTVSFAPLFFIRLAMGCGFGIFVVALTTYQSLVIPEERRGTGFAFITIGSLCCLFTVVPLADFLLAYSYTNVFLALPILVSIICVILSLKLPDIPENLKQDGEWGTWRELYNETPFWRIAISNVLFSICDAANIYLPLLASIMGFIPSSFSIANGAGALLVRTLGRRLFDIVPSHIIAGPSLFVMAVALCFTTIAESNFALVCCGFLFGVGMGYGYPAHLTFVGDLAPARLRAKLSALVHFCIDISWFILPLYVGFVAQQIGEVASFKILAAFCVLSGIFVTFMWKKYMKGREQ